MEHHSPEHGFVSLESTPEDHWFDPIDRPQRTIDYILAQDWQSAPGELITREDRAAIEATPGYNQATLSNYHRGVYRINFITQALDAVADIARAHNLRQWPYQETALALRDDMIYRVGTSDSQVPMPADIVHDVHSLSQAIKDELVKRHIADK